MIRTVTRRRFLGAASISIGSLALATCGGGSGGGPAPQAAPGPPPTAPPGPSPVPPPNAPSYSTGFDLAENPISEGGAWRRNQSNAWTNVRTANGRAFGTNGPADTYDDSYAQLSGFPADVQAEAVIFRDPALRTGITHEVELLFRVSDTASSVRCYECLFAYFGGIEIFRWNDQFGSFTLLGSASLGRELITGDVVKAAMVGNTLTCYINGQLLAQASDSMWQDGQPGIGFFTRPGGNSAHLAISSYFAQAL